MKSNERVYVVMDPEGPGASAACVRGIRGLTRRFLSDNNGADIQTVSVEKARELLVANAQHRLAGKP